MTIPNWFSDFEQILPTATHEHFSRFEFPKNFDRNAAVLILFGPHEDDADLLIIQRAAHLIDHPGQPAFPGGHAEPGDESLIQTALREAQEEVGVNPNSVRIVSELPKLWLPPSQVAVTPIVGWWESPHEITEVDSNEVAAVHRIPVRNLVNPVNRVTVKTRSGFLGPAFNVNDLIIWGFTGGLVSALLDLAGIAQEWDRTKQHELDFS